MSGAGLAILCTFFFALAAALQQKGEFLLSEKGHPVKGIGSMARLFLVPTWLLGTLVLLAGYATQGAALGRGRLVVIQPLLVLTIVFALPLGHWLTQQYVTRRQVYGAVVVVVGLALFVRIGDPSAGVDSASNTKYLVAIAVVGIPVAALLIFGTRAKPTLKAAMFGVAAGLLFGLCAVFAKPTVEELRDGLGAVFSHPEVYGLIAFGLMAFVIQQLSLATGQFAPAMVTVSVANPFISVILGAYLFEERLTRPFWHVILAALALLAAFAGAVLITMGNRERELPGGPAAEHPSGVDRIESA